MRPLLKSTTVNRSFFQIVSTGFRLRSTACMLAAIAVVSSMWAEIEFHHHETGLHKPIVCSLCAYEKAVAHGFTTNIAIGMPMPTGIDTGMDTPVFRLPAVACLRSSLIRAPPFA
jgi:hypothetical protein